ncbi:MAG: M48 family metallopeptidase [Planctomycetota bacterium]
MDFFDHQDRAKRRSGWLFVAFGLAVCAVSGAVYAVVGLIAAYAQRGESGPDMSMFGHPTVLLGGLGGTALLIVLGTLYRTAQLRGGGDAIALRLGGREIHPETGVFEERRLLNVVEEMAIASGTPVPPVYVLPERGMNAFAAGHGPEDAVVGVTQGLLEQLSRDELQGVVAHEFSHILHGDCRINLRLIGLLHGILVIGLAGMALMRVAPYMIGSGRSSRSSQDKGGGVAVVIAILALGATLTAIGYIGVACGSLIRAALSRQREFLADASAVQYTRNPDGIGGALRRIGGASHRGRVQVASAEESSHMFFEQAVPRKLAGLLATHPPLPLRIGRVLPAWDGTFFGPRPAAEPEPEAEATKDRRAEAMRVLSATALAGALASDAGVHGNDAADQATVARHELDRLPELWRDASHTPFGARAVVHALLLSRDAEQREHQMNLLRDGSDYAVVRGVEKLVKTPALEAGQRLVILELALGGLSRLTRPQYDAFRENVRMLIAADGKVDSREWLVQRLVIRVLDRRFGLAPGMRPETFTFGGLREEIGIALSAVAHMSGTSPEAAFETGVEALRVPYGVPTPELLDRRRIGLQTLDRAFERLERAKPAVKRQLLGAILAAMTQDDSVTAAEAELYRAIAAAMGVPVPLVTEGPSPSSV